MSLFLLTYSLEFAISKAASGACGEFAQAQLLALVDSYGLVVLQDIARSWGRVTPKEMRLATVNQEIPTSPFLSTRRVPCNQSFAS